MLAAAWGSPGVLVLPGGTARRCGASTCLVLAGSGCCCARGAGPGSGGRSGAVLPRLWPGCGWKAAPAEPSLAVLWRGRWGGVSTAVHCTVVCSAAVSAALARVAGSGEWERLVYFPAARLLAAGKCALSAVIPPRGVGKLRSLS